MPNIADESNSSTRLYQVIHDADRLQIDRLVALNRRLTLSNVDYVNRLADAENRLAKFRAGGKG